MASPAGVRAAIAAALLDALPTVAVVEFPRAIDLPTGPTVLLTITGVRPPDVACPAPVVELDAWAVTGLTEPGPADDALDTLLGDVLAALDSTAVASWTKAERGVWNDTHPSYRIALESQL